MQKVDKSVQRKIIHIDMDCFYAAVEMREDPSLHGKPVAVGGAPDKRGVLSTCNYEARKFGLHSAMPSATAIKKCPHLIIIPGRMALYKSVSRQIHEIFQRYTDRIEPLSLDEAYLDVTDSERCNGSATWIAQEIRETIYNELNLTASAGIAPLKFLAKIASEQNKPNGQFVITPDKVDEFIYKLPLKKIPGVGKVTAEKLTQMGLNSCADIQKFDQHRLLANFGKQGMRIWQFSHGIDKREVNTHRERKSVGVETTLLQDIVLLEDAYPILNKLYQELLIRLKRSQPDLELSQYRHIGVKLKFNDFTTTTLENSHSEVTESAFVELMSKIWLRLQRRSVRLIGLHVNLPHKNEIQQLSLW